MIHVTKLIVRDVFQSIDVRRHQLLLRFHSVALNDIIKAHGGLPIDGPRRTSVRVISRPSARTLPLIQRRSTLSNDTSNEPFRSFGHRQENSIGRTRRMAHVSNTFRITFEILGVDRDPLQGEDLIV